MIHGVKNKFLGACLVLEYCKNDNQSIGVLVDLVLCHTINGNIELHNCNQQARSFLKS